MKKFILTLTFAALALGAQAMGSGEIFKAMGDEMQRSMAQLKMPGMAKPYFMVYKLTPSRRFIYEAAQGALTEERAFDNLSTRVAIRVGSAKEDNSFFNSPIYSMSYRQYPGLSYEGIRAAFWDDTNKAYKDALSILAKKQAYKKSKNVAENYPDFSPAQTASSTTPPAAPAGFNQFKELAKELSAQGNMKELDSFTVTITAGQDPVYTLTSEGAEYINDKNYARILMKATAKTQNGFELKETKDLYYAALADIPAKEELLKQAKDFALQTAALTKAQKAEPFIGPILLEKAASAALLEDLFSREAERPRPVYSANSDPQQGEFAQKLGLRIMPAWFDVYSDPLTKTYNNKHLAGSYEVDDEGTTPQKLHIVAGGKLNALPTTRSLIKGQKTTNGHAVLIAGRRDLFAQGMLMNLFFLPQNPVPRAKFKDEFLQYCQSEGLDYCYIVRGSPLGSAFSAYKVNAKTGKETPVYGASIKDLSARTLRDIKFAADDMAGYNLALNVSVVAPSIVLGEAEIKPTQKLPARAPLVPRP